MAETLISWGLDREIEAVQTCTSELLAEALRRGEPPLHLVIRCWTDCVQVTVIDGAKQHRESIDKGLEEEADLRRRIVGALAGGWRLEPRPTGTAASFDFGIKPERTGPVRSRQASRQRSAIVGGRR